MRKTGTGSHKAQSALEFLATYGWALLIISLLIMFIFVFIDSERFIASSQCQFAYGVHCDSFSAYSNTMVTNIIVRLNNSQQYLLLNPTVNVIVGQYGSYQGTCVSSASGVPEGGPIVCNSIIPSHISTGTVLSGRAFINVTVCVSGNTRNCNPSQPQSYVGNFSGAVASRKNA